MSTITITISIDVPGGANVRVGNGGPAAASKPFTPRPDPEYPGGTCPAHGLEWKLIKAGVSKTKVDENGNPKRFNAFWTCPERGCDEKPDYNAERSDGNALDDLGF